MAVLNEKNKSKWTKDGRHWYFVAYYNDIYGKRKQYVSKKYISKLEAEQEELLFLAKRENHSLVKFSVVAMDYFKYMYQIRKESSIYSYENAYKNNIAPYFENLYINNINIQNINFWRLEMTKKGFKLNYLNKLYNIFKGIFDFAIKNYGLKENPVHLAGRFERVREEVVTDKERLRYITKEEFNKFIVNVDDITWKTFFIFLYYTGMRKGEIQALNWNDIDFTNNEIIVNKTLSIKTKEAIYKITSTKNYLNRKVKMSKILVDQLLEYKDYMKTFSDFNESWFVFGGPRFMPQITIDRKKHYYFSLCDVPEITIHEFRHSHVTLVVNEFIKKSNDLNIPIDATKLFLMLANRMGHTVQVMQRVYMFLIPTIQNEIVDILDNL